MSFEINSIQSAQIAGVGATVSNGSLGATTAAPQEAVHVDALPVAPPPELYDAFAVASQVYDKLAATGRHLHFDTGSDGRLQVELQDKLGNKIASVAPSAVLKLATGELSAAA